MRSGLNNNGIHRYDVDVLGNGVAIDACARSIYPNSRSTASAAVMLEMADARLWRANARWNRKFFVLGD